MKHIRWDRVIKLFTILIWFICGVLLLVSAYKWHHSYWYSSPAFIIVFIDSFSLINEYRRWKAGMNG